MILSIKKYPHPILRKKCLPISEVTEQIKKLSQDMIETMIANQGIGLAACQIGELKRIIVVYPIEEKTNKEKSKITPKIFINPKIVKKSREVTIDEEGCLSFPGLFLKIERAKEVTISALNENGKEISLEAKDLLARIFQHEIDHLDGVLFIDRLSFWQRWKIKNKLKKFQ